MELGNYYTVWVVGGPPYCTIPIQGTPPQRRVFHPAKIRGNIMTKRFFFSNGSVTVEQDIALTQARNEWYFDTNLPLLLIAEMRRQGFHYMHAMYV